MFKKIRIAILLFILASVAIGTYRSQAKVQGWHDTLQIVLYPINADGSDASARQIEQLNEGSFAPVEQYFAAQAKASGLDLSHPVRITLGPQVRQRPPAIPRQAGMLGAIRWSLNMRFWAWRNTPATAMPPDVRIFLLYHDPLAFERLPDSAGLAKGQLGLANIFAGRAMEGSNQVVIVHETLHTLGASDKYNPANNLPLFPQGFAKPEQKPLYPQRQAEIMAGRIAISPESAITPLRLIDTVVGSSTAQEIGWIKKQ